MGNVKLGKWEITENELERQHREALRRGSERMQTEPQAEAVQFDATTDRIIIALKNGVSVIVPRTLIQGLANATLEDIQAVRIGPRGASLHWETLGVDFSLASLLAGVFGTRAWMAEIDRRGGSITSVAKPSATRSNGKKGGRTARLLQE